MTTVLFTHNDLDGVTAEIVFRSTFPDNEVYRCNYNNMLDIMEDFINSHDLTACNIYIADLAIRETEQAKKIMDAFWNRAADFVFVDHHYKDSYWLVERYSTRHAHVSENFCGALLLHNWLNDKVNADYSPLVKLANDYDLWIHTNPHSKRLNVLLGLLGNDMFAERFLNNPDPKFDAGEELLVSIEERHRDEYIKKAIGRLIIAVNDNLKVAMVYASRYSSELGEAINRICEDLDAVIIFNVETMTAQVRSKKGLARDIASWFDGGGHPNAAGFPLGKLPMLDFENVFRRMFNKIVHEKQVAGL